MKIKPATGAGFDDRRIERSLRSLADHSAAIAGHGVATQSECGRVILTKKAVRLQNAVRRLTVHDAKLSWSAGGDDHRAQCLAYGRAYEM